MVKMNKSQGVKLARYADWQRIEREVKRLINEGNDRFTVDLGGFEVRFNGAKGTKDEGK